MPARSEEFYHDEAIALPESELWARPPMSAVDLSATTTIAAPRMTTLRTCVFPCAGFGTRFFPATKVIPKEMLPLVDKPILQYGIEEARDSGFDKLIIVTSKGKDTILDHFDRTSELERSLQRARQDRLLAEVEAVSRMVDLISVRQKEALGLGHAVLQAKDAVGNEPFAVVLPDDVILADEPCLLQMRRVFEETGRPVVALMEVSAEETSRYGIVGGEHARRPALPDHATWSRSRRSIRRRTTRSSAATSCRRRFSRSSRRPSAAPAARSSSPTRCASWSAPAISTATSSKGSATTPARSSAT